MSGLKRLVEAVLREPDYDAMDNRELAWRLCSSRINRDYEMGSPEDDIIQAVIRRLCREFDGDTWQHTEYGWMTPGGPIVYVKEKAPAC